MRASKTTGASAHSKGYKTSGVLFWGAVVGEVGDGGSGEGDMGGDDGGGGGGGCGDGSCGGEGGEYGGAIPQLTTTFCTAATSPGKPRSRWTLYSKANDA
eukprot:CAMPEP_0119087124 /NCGR_PEP_ID=MMETSP1178-20130426/140491_1 /TAXON_ID=33656 /ORGANISM="unid sp, Strain CCMP2000" /LENGTH=99 /DNA_ID=CAMNT_0007070305 /DNA_START=157 /DNA_END=453 /DNA_ORIENTATION=+